MVGRGVRFAVTTCWPERRRSASAWRTEPAGGDTALVLPQALIAARPARPKAPNRTLRRDNSEDMRGLAFRRNWHCSEGPQRGHASTHVVTIRKLNEGPDGFSMKVCLSFSRVARRTPQGRVGVPWGATPAATCSLTTCGHRIRPQPSRGRRMPILPNAEPAADAFGDVPVDRPWLIFVS